MSGSRFLFILLAVVGCAKDSGAPAASIPIAPASLTAVARIGEIVVSWHDAAANETSYRVEVSTTGDWTLLAETQPNATAVTHSGVEHGVTYHYRVRSCNESGCSAWVETSTAWVGGTAPSVIQVMVTALSTDHATLGANIAHGGAINTVYFLYAPVGQDVTKGVRTASQEIHPPLGNIEGNAMIFTIVYGLTEGTTYNVMAVATSGFGAASGTGTFTTSRTGAPIIPAASLASTPLTATTARVTATLDPGGMTASYWFDVVPADSSFDQARRFAGAGSPLTTGNVSTITGNITDLRAATNYKWRAGASNTAGTTYSDAATFRTPSQ